MLDSGFAIWDAAHEYESKIQNPKSKIRLRAPHSIPGVLHRLAGQRRRPLASLVG